ncbi:MAG TPA: IS66 family transposase [Terriglobales bacterium]|nr:IS66 family transposase [Terriglobales bacterium]
MSPREAELTRQLEQALQLNAALQRENQLLREKVNLLVRRVFGSSSEKMDAAQLQLLLAGAELVEPAPEPKSQAPAFKPQAPAARKPKTPRLPETLPVVEEIIDPEPVKVAPEQFRQIGQEVSEQLDYEPARYFRRRLVRRTYVSKVEPDNAPVTAPLPPTLQERCIATPALLAQVAVFKYCDHIPLYRQEQILARRYGINLPRQTLARWVELISEWLRPIHQQIKTGVMAGGYVQLDETPINYLEPGAGRTLKGYLWTGSRPGGDVFFDWHASRAGECLDTVVPADFQGTVQCDGYDAYNRLAQRPDKDIKLAHCWAHVRRKFNDAREGAPRTAGWMIKQIQLLYRIESRLREQKAGPALRQAVRASQSKPIVERIGKACELLVRSKRFLPKSGMQNAMEYTLAQMPGLLVYLEDGRIEIDNNLVENAIRPTALGKKNWLFIGEAEAGDRSAIIYTVIESCRRRGLDPYAYLKDVLTRLPQMTFQRLPEVLPAAWGKPQPLRKAS